MKSLINSFFIAVSMYSTVPTPNCDWNSKNMKNAMCFFPFISFFCSLGLLLSWKICTFFKLSSMLFGVTAIVINVFITGGIHIDGFCDTSDALFSRRSQEEKLRILKDSSCGTFAILGIILVLMISVVSYSEIYSNYQLINCIIPVFAISRTLSGISVVSFKSTSTSSLAKLFGENAGKNVKKILIIELLFFYLLNLFINFKSAILNIIISLSVFLWYKKMCEKEFGGITGDLAGFFLVVCETLCIFLTAILGGVLI